MATDRLDRIALVLSAGAIGFCFGEWLAPAMKDQRIQWETLITGMLAIAAAAWSVRAAMRVDNEQERRHREIYRLTLRADRLRVQRAQHPASVWLRKVHAEGNHWLERYESERVKGVAPSEEVMDGLLIEADKFVNSVRDVSLADAADLFDPLMTQRYRLLMARAGKIEQAASYLRAHRLVVTLPGNQNELPKFTAGLVVVFNAILGEADVFADDLTKLAFEYTTDSPRARVRH
ncbi:hypothetical protein [Mesorhizobium qingshengii]|uniref:Uncharacterized protein n=1 Tax=Mesorhizobium qingshengii TaxID=1165689 RepID=A0A1G5V0H6_9HYPH|nr:hypothetical protein [Mesorhizobium qingshengii]SDA39391.1 hypothetical protein SAMN02927914_00141 [Mesorhizobium qingshengii]